MGYIIRYVIWYVMQIVLDLASVTSVQNYSNVDKISYVAQDEEDEGNTWDWKKIGLHLIAPVCLALFIGYKAAKFYKKRQAKRRAMTLEGPPLKRMSKHFPKNADEMAGKKQMYPDLTNPRTNSIGSAKITNKYLETPEVKDELSSNTLSTG